MWVMRWMPCRATCDPCDLNTSWAVLCDDQLDNVDIDTFEDFAKAEELLKDTPV